MSDSLVDRYASRRAEQREPEETPDSPDDHGSFGWLRGIRDRAVMLELRFKDGRVLACGYSWLEAVEFDPSEGITLFFAGRRIQIKGTNLNREVAPNVSLLGGLIRQRIPWIQEADGGTVLQSLPDICVVDEVKLL